MDIFAMAPKSKEHRITFVVAFFRFHLKVLLQKKARSTPAATMSKQRSTL